MPHNPFHEPEEPQTGEENDLPESIQDRVRKTGGTDRRGGDRLAWVDVVAESVIDNLVLWGEAHGYSEDIMEGVYARNASGLFDMIQHRFLTTDLDGPGPANPGYYTGTTQGLQTMIDFALNWFGGKAGIDLSNVSPRRTSGSRGSGSCGPTAADIRNQYDIAELTKAVQEINRSLVFSEHPDPKGVAQQYIESVVATGGKKKIDFQTFVEGQIEKTARYQAIYRDKPGHLNARQWIAPYIGAASQYTTPDRAEDVAIAGAQFGASPEQFRQRLKREDSVTGSAPFIQGLEGRMRELNSIFKG